MDFVFGQGKLANKYSHNARLVPFCQPELHILSQIHTLRRVGTKMPSNSSPASFNPETDIPPLDAKVTLITGSTLMLATIAGKQVAFKKDYAPHRKRGLHSKQEKEARSNSHGNRPCYHEWGIVTHDGDT